MFQHSLAVDLNYTVDVNHIISQAFNIMLTLKHIQRLNKHSCNNVSKYLNK